ncbi:MAG: chemotaxis response regulator protein-glutamate methylesterase [Coriobacteriia bacterium]|nr:chemotaxis response regulator protein-glutamate methylesterase [Coriobacteriia bacterium]
MHSAIKVLVVDDSALIRQMLTRALSLDPRIEVVGVAQNGVEAIEKARALEPDVITLDVEMPELTGLEALPHLTRHTKARVIMLSTLDDPDTTYSALSRGAVDFLTKPKAGVASSIAELSEQLLKKIRIAYRVDPERMAATERVFQETPPPVVPERADKTPIALDYVVAVAASTGGPPALERVFSGLNSAIPAAFLLVQHLPAGFTASLARRLSSASDIPVLEAREGMVVRQGTAYVAPYGVHMTVTRTDRNVCRLLLEDSEPVHGVRPAADPLFEAVARTYGERSVGVVLTGMGSDGAQGMVAIRDAGGETIVQNEETSVVWGMPGAAVKRKAAGHVVPLGLVAAEIRRTMRRKV